MVFVTVKDGPHPLVVAINDVTHPLVMMTILMSDLTPGIFGSSPHVPMAHHHHLSLLVLSDLCLVSFPSSV